MQQAKARSRVYDAPKRLIDIVGAMGLLLILAPLLVIIGALVRMKLGSPILFRQERAGLGGRVFRMVKFRTMTDACAPDGSLLPDARRLTRFGRLLRSTSMDELPELLNVLAGDMSLVGPRPLLVRYLERYTPDQSRRHEVRPGITGWAQVRGRNSLSWEEKFRLDVWYVDHRSARLDLRILVETFLHLLQPRGIAAAGEATNSEFMGSRT
jgi:lipopolysaccharide/colanic/teichoic acid biosynthesis glycosyltransferase